MNTIDTCCFPNWVGSMLTNWEALIWLGTKDAVRVPDPSHYWHTNLHGTGIISMLFRNECSVTSNCWKCVINEVFVRKEELPINLLDEGRFKMRNFQVCLASYLSIVQQGDAGSVFRGFRTSFYPFYLSTCLQLLFLLLTVDTWRWHPIFAELREELHLLSRPFVKCKRFLLLIWTVCSSCQANNVLSCGCLGSELGEKKSKRESNNSFSPSLTPQVLLSERALTSMNQSW